MMEGSTSMEKGYDRIAPTSETQTQLESRLLSFHQLCRRMISVCISTFII
jgi:hypothetical protein